MSPTEIDLHLGFDPDSFNPGQFVIQACTQSQGTISSGFAIGMMPSPNAMAIHPQTGVFLDVLGLYSQNEPYIPFVYHYAADGTLVDSWYTGSPNDASTAAEVMGLIPTTGDLVFVENGMDGIVVTNQDGVFTGAGGSLGGLAVAAEDGYAMNIPIGGKLIIRRGYRERY